MTKKLHIIYVPGIKDDRLRVQSLLVSLWKIHGIHGYCHEMPWFGPETFEPKLKVLLDKIDLLYSQDDKVALVGASAGASAIINAYVERRDAISGLVYICGKINQPDNVSNKTYSANPAFKASMFRLQKNLPSLTQADKAKMHSFYSPVDRSVPHKDTVIPGVDETQLPRLGHGAAIIYSLSLGASHLLHPLKPSE